MPQFTFTMTAREGQFLFIGAAIGLLAGSLGGQEAGRMVGIVLMPVAFLALARIHKRKSLF